MDLLRKYLLPSAVLRYPDDGGAPDPAPESPPPVAEADPPAADPAPEPVADPEHPAPVDHGNKGKKPWFLERISQEAEARRQAEQRAADAEALAARLQRGGDAPPLAAEPPAQDFNAAVRTAAAQLKLQEDSTAVRDAGLKKFGSVFLENLAVLNAVGATSDDIVLDLLAVDKTNAHEILSNLATDPEKAASLVGMDSRRRIAELTRMADALKVPANNEPAPAPKGGSTPPKQVSRAPAPPPPVEPSATKITDWRSDDASDEEFDRGFKETMQKRSLRR